MADSDSLDPALIEKLFDQLAPGPASAADRNTPAALPLTPIAPSTPPTSRETSGPLEMPETNRAVPPEPALLAPEATPPVSGDGPKVPMPDPAAPRPIPKKPKIDFAALRKARGTNFGDANLKVGKLFGKEGAASAPSIDPPPEPPHRHPFRDATHYAQESLEHAGSALTKTIRTWADQIREFDAGVFLAIGVLGVLFAINGVLILVFAIKGWI